MDPVSVGTFIASGGAAGLLAWIGKEVHRIIRARRKDATDARQDQKDEILRGAEREKACEERYVALGKKIDEVRDTYQTKTTETLMEAAVAIRTAAEVQREGNIIQREQTHVLDRVCRRLEGLPCARDEAERPTASEKTPLHQKHA